MNTRSSFLRLVLQLVFFFISIASLFAPSTQNEDLFGIISSIALVSLPVLFAIGTLLDNADKNRLIREVAEFDKLEEKSIIGGKNE